jgi:hypothetical protein
MENNFDLKKFLVENKLTPSSQKLNELKYSVKPSKKGFSVVKTSTGDEITSFDTEEKAKQHVEKLNKMKFIPKEKFNEETENRLTPAAQNEDLTDPFPRFQGSTMKEFVRWAVPIFKANNVAKEDYIDWFRQIDDDGGVSDYKGATEKELMDVHFAAWYPEYGSEMPNDEPYADKIKKSRY